MAPVPLEGQQAPVVAVSAEGQRGGSISLALLIDFIVQRTYHELTVLAELLPRKTDMERKIEIYNFSARTRQLFVRLLALVKWANSASKVDKSAHIMAFLDKQSLLFVDTADMLARMARETLVHARLPNFHIPAAVEVLTTGTYGRLPLCIRDRIVPADPISPVERRTTLQRLNQVIQHRLVTGNLLPQMRNLKIDSGRVTFHVKHEFEVSLTVMGDGPNIPWRLLEVDILVEDKETGDGKALVHPLQVQYVHQILQARLADHPNPLNEVYSCLHFFAQSLQLEVLYSQALRLKRDRLDNHINVDDYIPGQRLTVWYWREVSNKEPRSELGYKLTIQVDQHDSARPLAVIHSPSLGNKEVEIAEAALHSAIISLERLLVHTIYVRTKTRLSDLRSELQTLFPGVECTVSGVPAVLYVPLLQPCQKAEQLHVNVDTHTGILQCFVPQYEAPVIPDLINALNGDHTRLLGLLSELRFWMMQRRCEKTLMHLPASIKERLPLIMPQDNPIAARLGKHRMLVQLHRHPSAVLIVDLNERQGNVLSISCSFFLAVVEKASAVDDDTPHVISTPEDAIVDHEAPKPYLKVTSLMEFDTFVTTHGPWTSVEEPGRRRPLAAGRDSRQRSKHPAYFIPELAHVVALCDERIPFLALAHEFTKRNILHQGIQVVSGATGLVLRLVTLPPPPGVSQSDPGYLALMRRLLSASVRACTRTDGRTWLLELVFSSSPLQTLHPKEQGNRRPVYLQYETLPEHNASKTVQNMLSDWTYIARLYSLVEELSENFKVEKYNLASMCVVKSFNYNKLIVGYGPDKGASISVQWSKEKNGFSLVFGATGRAVLAHSLVREQLEAFLNQHKNLARLIYLLQDTYEPLASILQLSTLPQLCVNSLRPQVPVQTWTIVAETPTLLRLVYQGTYCLELRIRGGGLVSIRDGAYSYFDRACVMAELSPTQWLKTFLSKYVTETSTSRRRSQSEDDNPPSPVTLDSDSGSLLSGRGPQSPANRDGLRFHPPLTPPSGSNPHTPASPHTSSGGMTSNHQTFGSSPATSFSLASPPSLSTVNQSASPGVGLMSGSSPSNPLQMPSPLMTSASPQPAMVGHSPAGSFMASSHMDGSPFPASQGMASPATSNWPGSPNVPRPSPARPGQSPGAPSHMTMHSPDHKPDPWQQSRVVPPRCWAGAVPALLTYKALDLLCRPCPTPPPGPNTSPPQVPPGTPDLCPLERFLGCIFMRRQMQRFVVSEEVLQELRTTEPGVHFKTESIQCRIVLNPNHLQTLHMKVGSLPDHKDQLGLDEIQIIEKFFEMRVACPPFKPNSFLGLARMFTTPYYVLKDFIQLMKMDLMPSLCQQQNFKWSIQLCLRVPPSCALHIVPTGQAGVLMCRSKILFFVQVTRLVPGGEGASFVLPLVYDMSLRSTSVAEKRDLSPPVAVHSAYLHLKRFADFSSNSGVPQECTLLMAVRDLIMNLTLPTEVPQGVTPPGPPMQGQMAPQLQSPVGMMHPSMGMPQNHMSGPMGPNIGMGGPMGGPGPGAGPMGGMGVGPVGMGPGVNPVNMGPGGVCNPVQQYGVGPMGGMPQHSMMGP